MNRVLAEGRERFREVFASSEDGTRCRELRPLLSSFCDGEASAADADTVRAHLQACAGCRATMRGYRAAPRIVAGVLPASRSLLERLQDAFGGLWSRVSGPGGAADSAAGVAASGGTRGLGAAALAKLAAVCAGAAGGAACVATGVVPMPLVVDDRPPAPIERQIERPAETASEASAETEPVAIPEAQTTSDAHGHDGDRGEESPASASSGAVEYEPAPAPVEAEAPAPSVPESAPTTSSSGQPSAGSAAGEFGP